MGKPPAVIIVTRHGTRLDAADKQWHLTSPAPYDPPLTYGGWRQAHALGARIATILQNRETTPGFQLPGAALQSNGVAEEGSRRNTNHSIQATGQRKHKVIIHTSPFLRCIQTSIAISGGMAEAQADFEASGFVNHKHAMHSAHPLHSASPRVRGMDHWSSPQLSAISEPEEESEDRELTNGAHKKTKPHLRVDAFLGEWLSPGYYEDITHPPHSRMMVATAKANLLHERNYEAIKQTVTKVSPSIGNFPGGWGGGKAGPVSADNGPLDGLPTLNQSLPRLNRSGSHSMAGSLAHRGSFGKPENNISLPPDSTMDQYVLPVPSYALSPSAPIPAGYVAYAKNTCLDVDYQWDSMRTPHEWGDGGQFGEEWSSMHQRFRHGLKEMITWYSQHDNTKRGAPIDGDDLPEDDDDENTDTVLVLVTHSAGCNALIGALTNQPVLLDPGLLSLTMAVRKPAVNGHCQPLNRPPLQTSNQRRSSIDFGVSEDYDVKIAASTEHLRTGSTSSSLRSSRASSPSGVGQRFRSTSEATTTSRSSILEELPEEGVSNGLGTLKRSATTGLWTKPPSAKSNGLWSKPIDKVAEIKPSREHSPLRESTSIKNILSEVKPEKNERPVLETLSPLTIRSGLWGAPPPATPSDRERGPKRRWTLHEQS